ncbi:hypothetical protein CASFOL_032743 [Castilleja foliolosa]|uniref:U1-type domain-containing protein n=1 Tax=Castilleja foliolosa TaxID=1961234 RepID=A0ABD3C536_9LAMI
MGTIVHALKPSNPSYIEPLETFVPLANTLACKSIQEINQNMAEFTDEGKNQDSKPILPISGHFAGNSTHEGPRHLSTSHQLSLASPSLLSALSPVEIEMIREIEKEKIRKEIIREEMIISEIEKARWRALASEVRSELGMQMKYFAPQMVHGLSFRLPSPQMMGYDVSSMSRSLHLNAIPEGPTSGTKFAPLLNQELHNQSRVTEVNPLPGGAPEKKKLIILGGEPTPNDENVSGSKRKAEALPAPAAEGIDVPSVEKKKTKKGWYHFRGRNQKSKEPVLSANNDTTNIEPVKADEENPGYKFWCDVCKVGTHTEDVMSAHKKGRKHLSRLGRNEAKVSVLVNDIAEWVDSYEKKSTSQENQKLIETVKDESVILTEPEKSKAVEYIFIEEENISEGSNVDELESLVKPEDDKQLVKAESENDKVVDVVCNEKNVTEDGGVEGTKNDELVDDWVAYITEPENSLIKLEYDEDNIA